MRSCLYDGWVRHRRRTPVEHAFRYRLFMVCLDLGELETVFAGRWFWSTRRPAPLRYRRQDYLGGGERPLDEAARDLVAEHSGRRPTGRVLLLTHLRTFGYLINPVSFYYCYDDDDCLRAIVADITNTPWGERHAYVLTRDDGIGRHGRFTFAKDFHVSPFLPMDIDYDWRFADPGEQLSVHMALARAGEPVFDATLSMTRRPIDGRQLARALVRHPLLTARVWLGIYWQAARLHLKGVPFHSHPKWLAPRTDGVETR